MPPRKSMITEREGETLILTPQIDLGELGWLQFGEEAREVLRTLEDTSIRQVVVDLQHADSLGSDALAWLVRLLKRMSERGGHLVLCRLSPHAREILRVVQMDQVFTSCSSRAEAMARVRP
jgi:anti-anti-sigma factor